MSASKFQFESQVERIVTVIGLVYNTGVNAISTEEGLTNAQTNQLQAEANVQILRVAINGLLLARQESELTQEQWDAVPSKIDQVIALLKS